VRFKTFPDPRLPSGNRFRFIVSSCQTPNFPYRPLASRRIKGYDLLAEYLWPTPPKESPVSEEVLIMEELLHDMPNAQVKETTENVEPMTAITSSEASLTSGEVETETNTVPLPTAVAEGSIPELEVTPEPEATAPAEFMLFLGDFVYADVPVWWGDSKEAYRRLYRRIYNSPRFEPYCLTVVSCLTASIASGRCMRNCVSDPLHHTSY
jgi:alkaline phosphatase D